MSNLPVNYAQLVLRVRDAMNLSVMVETGSFSGYSASWAADHFDYIISIDIREVNQVRARERCIGKSVAFVIGDSRKELSPLLHVLNQPVFLWSDAHEEKGQFGCGWDDCPVLEELQAVVANGHKHAVLIDDRHYFEAPYDPVVFPRRGKIEELMNANGYKVYDAAYALMCLPEGIDIGNPDDLAVR